MEDLNDLVYFAEVVNRGGFAAAGRALNLPKSRLSRRVAELDPAVVCFGHGPPWRDPAALRAFAASIPART